MVGSVGMEEKRELWEAWERKNSRLLSSQGGVHLDKGAVQWL